MLLANEVVARAITGALLDVNGGEYMPGLAGYFPVLHAAHRLLAALEMAARPLALIRLFVPRGRPGPRFPVLRPLAPLSARS